MMRTLVTLLVCCALFSCQHSPRKNYYLLTPQATKTAASADSSPTTLIGIGPITVADYLNRLRIIYQTDDNKVMVADNDYWAEPLDKGISRVIALNLGELDNTRNFVSFPWRTDSIPHYSLRLQIYSLNQNANDASINATWEIFDNVKKASVEKHQFSRTTPAQHNSQALAQAYSKLLAELSKDIDSALRKIN